MECLLERSVESFVETEEHMMKYLKAVWEFNDGSWLMVHDSR